MGRRLMLSQSIFVKPWSRTTKFFVRKSERAKNAKNERECLARIKNKRRFRSIVPTAQTNRLSFVFTSAATIRTLIELTRRDAPIAAKRIKKLLIAVVPNGLACQKNCTEVQTDNDALNCDECQKKELKRECGCDVAKCVPRKPTQCPSDCGACKECVSQPFKPVGCRQNLGKESFCRDKKCPEKKCAKC